MNRERGFLLLDVIVAGLILSIGLTYLVGVSLAARKAVHASLWKARAANLAQSELEEIKTLGVEQALASGKVLPHDTVESVQANGLRLQVYSDWVPGNPDLLEIKVTGLWSHGPDSGAARLDTLVFRR